jgi:hypothetical protein
MPVRSLLDFSKYFSWTDQEVWSQYADVCSELANLRVGLATMKAQEHRTKLNEFWTDQGSSVAARSRAADYAASEISCSIMETEGKINALYEEQQFIEHMVKDYNHAVNLR